MFVYLQPQSLPLGLQKRAVGQQKSIRKRPKNDLQRVSRDCSNFEFSDSIDLNYNVTTFKIPRGKNNVLKI